MGRTGRGRRLGTRTDRQIEPLPGFTTPTFARSTASSPRRSPLGYWGGRANGPAPSLACEKRLQLLQARVARIRRGEPFREAASWPCKRSELRILTKENESETRAGGERRGWERWRGRPGGARPRRAWRRPRRVGQGPPGGRGERPAEPATAGAPTRAAGPAKDANASHHAQEAAAQPRPGSHSSRLPFPLSPAPRGPAPGRRDSCSLRPLGFPKPVPDPGAPARLDVREGGTHYLSSPGLNRSPSPPSPPRSAITDSRVHLPPTRRSQLVGGIVNPTHIRWD